MNENADEIVKALRRNRGECNLADVQICMASADLIEQMEQQLTESQQRERAAVEDLELNAACPCRVCKNAKCYRRNGRENCKFEWRGPQAGKGEAE